jgi:putative transcriptional regulator
MSDGDSLVGRLLVASPALLDPNFHRTVVLIIRHDSEGAFGLVLNRPIEEVPVSEHLPAWSESVSAPPVIFRGGPVEPSVAIALGRFPENAMPGEEAGIPGVSTVDLSGDEPPAMLESLRIYSGCAGWSPGQLEGELKESAWFVVDAKASDVFSPEPEHLWREVLKRQAGALAMFAHFPTNPSAN